jgi:hypothetical protein
MKETNDLGEVIARRCASLLRLFAACSVGLAVLGAPVARAEVGPLALPDNRVWEQVSPVDKQGNDVFRASAMAAVEGNRLMFKSAGAFAGAPTALGFGGGVYYVSTRGGEGWETRSIMPPVGTEGEGSYQAFTADLSRGVLHRLDRSEPLDPASHPPGWNLYLHDAAIEPFELLNTFDSMGLVDSAFTWGSSDLGKIAITAGENALTPDSPCGSDTVFEPCSYEWDHGEMRLASVLPNGEAVQGVVGNRLPVSSQDGNAEHALSGDGARLFFSSPPNASAPQRQLYVREEGLTLTTQLVTASERTASGGTSGGQVSFQDAEAAHGDRVAFTTTNTLVDADEDTTNDLYLADLSKPEGERLTLISEDQNPEAPNGAAVNSGTGEGPFGGLVGASEDLRRIYFVADNQIVAGAPEAPGPKLYLWDDTGAEPHLTYIRTLVSEDSAVWRSLPVGTKESRTTADGRFLAILSRAKLTEFENEGRVELYLYDAASGSLQCASCSDDAFPADGAVRFRPPESGLMDRPPLNHELNNVSEDGKVFFQTSRGLVSRDSNGKTDVYEYSGGELHLISAGTGGEASYFLDATPSGSDVFFMTLDRLVGWDKDELYDAYDARVGGGLPEPPPPPPPCEGDSCQPPPVVPVDPSLASAAFNGPGDAKPRKARRCRGGKVRRQGRCRAKRKATPSHSHRHTTHSHG